MAEAKPKRIDTRARRHALNMKTTLELRQKLQERADKSGRVLTHEVEQQLIRSFELEEQLALSEAIREEMKGNLAARERLDAMLWPTEADRVAASIFATAIHQCQLVKGASWRDDASVALTIGKATGETLRKFARDYWSGSESQGIFSRLLGPVPDSNIADVVSDELFSHYKDVMPSLPPLGPQADPARWSGMGRAVVTFKDKATGEAVDRLEGPVRPLSELSGAQIPGLVEFTDKHRANKDNLDVDISVVHILRDEGSIWDAPEPKA